eukprot:scaffold3822_cov68-Phaeocystis_antarctica.AAC.4
MALRRALSHLAERAVAAARDANDARPRHVLLPCRQHVPTEGRDGRSTRDERSTRDGRSMRDRRE